jgi:hypothetical protein
VHEPASHHAELVEPDLRRCDVAATRAAIRIEQRPNVTTRLERIALSACDDREVVRWIAGASELPVDHERHFAGHEEDVLTEQITVQQGCRLGWWKMIVHPDASSGDRFRNRTKDARSYVEYARGIQGIVTACRDLHVS